MLVSPRILKPHGCSRLVAILPIHSAASCAGSGFSLWIAIARFIRRFVPCSNKPILAQCGLLDGTCFPTENLPGPSRIPAVVNDYD